MKKIAALWLAAGLIWIGQVGSGMAQEPRGDSVLSIAQSDPEVKEAIKTLRKGFPYVVGAMASLLSGECVRTEDNCDTTEYLAVFTFKSEPPLISIASVLADVRIPKKGAPKVVLVSLSPNDPMDPNWPSRDFFPGSGEPPLN